MTKKPRILIVDDDSMMAKTIADIIKTKGFEAVVAGSASEALDNILAFSFDGVISDIKMPEVNGTDLYRTIKKIQPDLPVVLMTAYSDDNSVKEGLEEGAIAVLSKPLDMNALLSFCFSLEKKLSVVIVDDDPKFCITLGQILRVSGFSEIQVTDPRKVLTFLDKGNGVDIVILDMKLGEVNGLSVLENIRQHNPVIPVILVTGYREEMARFIKNGLSIGAYDCLYKPFNIEDLLGRLNEIYHRKLSRILCNAIEQ
jgi:DNA-binding response OmpR family regulator